MESSLIWTSELPKVAGWYWYREADGLTIVELMVLSERLQVLMYQNQRGKWQFELELSELPGQWAGPLIPPEENL